MAPLFAADRRPAPGTPPPAPAIVPHHTLRSLYELERQARTRGDLISIWNLERRITDALRAE